MEVQTLEALEEKILSALDNGRMRATALKESVLRVKNKVMVDKKLSPAYEGALADLVSKGKVREYTCPGTFNCQITFYEKA